MRYLTPNELGFSFDGTSDSSTTNHGSHEAGGAKQRSSSLVNAHSSHTSKGHQSPSTNSTYTSRIGQNNSIIISKAKILQKIESIQQLQHNFYPFQKKDSYLVPPEGLDEEYDDELAEEVKELAAEAAQNLAAKNKNGKVGLYFLYSFLASFHLISFLLPSKNDSLTRLYFPLYYIYCIY